MTEEVIDHPEVPLTVVVVGVGQKKFSNLTTYDEMTAIILAQKRGDNSGVRAGSRGFASFVDWDTETRVLRLKFNSAYAS